MNQKKRRKALNYCSVRERAGHSASRPRLRRTPWLETTERAEVAATRNDPGCHTAIWVASFRRFAFASIGATRPRVVNS